MKLILSLAVSGVCLLLPARASFAQGAVPAGATIAYVSGQRISNESAEGKAGNARVAALQREKAADLQARQQSILRLQQQVAQASDEAARGKLRLEEQQQQAAFQQAVAQAQADVQKLQREIAAELVPRVRAVLSGLLAGTDVKVVLNSEPAIMWGDPALDLTDAVIERLDAVAPGASTR